MAAAAALSVRTTTTTSLHLAAVVSLCVVVVSLSLRVADAARVSPGASPIVATCMTGPYPELCVGELGQRLLEIQTVIASAAPNQAAKIAGAPGQVDVKGLVSVALEAATEAGTIAMSIFEGKLPGFNTSVPDFHKCLGNCTVTMRAALQKLHGAKAALQSGDSQVAKTLALRSAADVSSCTISCRDINGDVRLIVVQSLGEFTKMLQIAIGFISKMKSPPGAQPSPALPPPTPEAKP